MDPGCRHDRRPRRAELADIVRAASAELAARCPLTGEQRSALAAIARCRTPALGGHAEVCAACGHRRTVYRSCKNRHCPKCSVLAKERWLQARRSELMPTGYVHVVFTLPHAINDLARRRPRLVYEALFRSASRTLLAFAADPRHLGAAPAVTAVLHTWTQRLDLHIHLHCIVTAGGLDPTRRRWIKSRGRFLFPVRALSHVFRAKYLDALRDLGHAPVDVGLRVELTRNDWVVYAKAPPVGPAALLDYLARYSHRVAIANERILRFNGQSVWVRWRDSARGNKKRVLSIEAVPFLRRFVQHVLPRGFKRVRHYGLLAPAGKARALEACRRYFGIVAPLPTPITPKTLWERLGADVSRCDACGAPAVHIATIPASREPRVPRGPP